MPPTAVAVVGPTAAGKSTVALAAARALGDVEVVVVDALQVYRGMDIGTAKPTPAERAEIPHHGLDLAEPSEEVTVVRYLRAYDDAVAGIAARGHRPLLVGGTGLYVRAAVDRLEPPGEWPAVRPDLELELDTTVLHAQLQRLDPAAAARMEPTNRRRVVRALEVTIGSGRPFSSFGAGLDRYPAAGIVQIGLRWSRADLQDRIEARFAEMLAAGFVDEVSHLAAGPAPPSRTARQAIGYAELLDYVAGRCPLDEAISRAVRRTRRLAVRQERWFRRDPRVHWVDISTDPLDAIPAVLGALAACV
ncbi:MAG TPA: tRNA (adenosine(37)-N6)-dimethylallyltransferase MiaA [Acidimicrobiales bacterium]|nr:tRNA (adenosine(37)-N6)-dimethylallyltransferase MiaA [Acidimicrobiales bacterium]